MKKIKKQIDLSYIGGLCLMLALILVLYCMVAAYGSKADDSSIKNVSDYDGYIGKTWVNAEDPDEVYSFTITALDRDSIVPFFQGIFLQNSDGTFPHNATVTDVILYGNDSINFQKEANAPKGLPDALEDEIRETLSDGSFSQFIEKYETVYRQLSDSEKQEYAVKDETRLLARCLEELKTKDDAWFVPEGTDDILIRHEEKGGRYSYYAFQRGHGKDSYLMRAVGLNEEFYVITWNESRYLLTTKRKNNVLTGIAVYCMYGEDSYGWLLYQEKTQDGGIVSRYYSYVDDEGGIGTYWPEYEFLYD